MRKNDSLSTFHASILLSDQDDQSSDASPPHSPPPSHGRDIYASPGSLTQTSAWPQSYKQSMDAYSSLASPSFLSPGLSRLSSSYGSFRRRGSIERITPQIAPLLDEKLLVHEPTSVVSSRASSCIVKDAEADTPPPRQCSTTQAVLNGLNVLCGVGVLTTPYAIKECGWFGLGILLMLSIVSWYTGILLRRCLDSERGLATYPDIGQAAFGNIGRLLISIALYFELYACCVEFLILEGDNMSALFPNAGVSINGFEMTALQVFTLLAALIILPTVWIRDLSLLSYVSAGGVIASFVVVICVAWIGTFGGVGFSKTGPLFNLSGLPVAIGLFGFCYSGHAVFPNIYTSLRDPSKYTLVLTISFSICTVIYGGMAIMGFTMFGSETESQITLNLPSKHIISKVAVWTTIVNPFTKYALTMTPVALSLEELIPSSSHGLPNFFISMAIRTVLVVSTLSVALLVPYFAYVMSFIGSLLSMLVCLILPSACFLKIVGQKATILQVFFCITIILIGVACAVAGTYSSVAGIISSIGS